MTNSRERLQAVLVAQQKTRVGKLNRPGQTEEGYEERASYLEKYFKMPGDRDGAEAEQAALALQRQRKAVDHAIIGAGNAVSLGILSSLIVDVRRAWKPGDGALKDVYFGLVPGGGLDAYVFREDGGGSYCVAVPDGFFDLINLTCKLVVLLQPWVMADGGLRYLPTAGFHQMDLINHPYIRFRQADLLKAFFFDGDPKAALSYPIPPAHQDRFGYLLHGTEIFLLAHEIGHVVLGHFSFTDETTTLDDELAADVFAFDIVKRHFEDHGYDYCDARATLCATLFLSILDLWEQVTSAALAEVGAEPTSATHPDWQRRQAAILASIPENEAATPPWYIFVHNAIQLATRSDEFVREVVTAGGASALSASVLPAEYAHLGTHRSDDTERWVRTVAELLTSNDPSMHRLGRWFLFHYTPNVPYLLYLRVLEEEDDASLYSQAIARIQPIYGTYLPRLRERFREEARQDELDSYLINLASYLAAEAGQMSWLEPGMSPMNPRFWD